MDSRRRPAACTSSGQSVVFPPHAIIRRGARLGPQTQKEPGGHPSGGASLPAAAR